VVINRPCCNSITLIVLFVLLAGIVVADIFTTVGSDMTVFVTILGTLMAVSLIVPINSILSR